MEEVIIRIPLQEDKKGLYENTLDKINGFFGGYRTLSHRTSMKSHFVMVTLKPGYVPFLDSLWVEYFVVQNTLTEANGVLDTVQQHLEAARVLFSNYKKLIGGPLDGVSRTTNVPIQAQMADALLNKEIMKDKAVQGLLKACQDFVDKVERGEARSKKSYKQMKEAITQYEYIKGA
jgi:hypothetical protein